MPHAVTAVLLRLAARPRLKSVGDGWSRAGRSDVAVELPVLAWRAGAYSVFNFSLCLSFIPGITDYSP